MTDLPSYFNRTLVLTNEKFPDRYYQIVKSDSAYRAYLFDGKSSIELDFEDLESTIHRYTSLGWKTNGWKHYR